ncbi:MAG: D-alanyl-D-alanine carboxypeptidase [Clostridia bacterium]|nr:D-alanyl-D-alanine carboxypeptidase [Clostridia bacterium]
MQNQPPKTTKRRGNEGFFCVFMIILILFEILLVAAVLARTLASDTPPANEETQTTSPTDTAPPVGDSTPSTPVFSGGVIPSPPTQNASTVSLSGEIDSQYAILIDAETGEILAQKGADVKFSPASMTKVMTLIVACEQLTEADLNRRLALTEEIVTYVTSGNYYGTEVALPRELSGISCIGDSYYIKDLLYGIGVMSAADCTYMIAKEVSGSEEAFVALMNQKAKALGLNDTHFDNAVGFDSETNTTTARDMAVIMAYAMQSDLITDILKPRSENLPILAYYLDNGVEKNYKVWLKPSLESRMSKYPAFSLDKVKLTATKTGYTTESFIVSAAKGLQNGKTYIVVLGNATTTHTSISEKLKATMIDLEKLYNLYVK